MSKESKTKAHSKYYTDDASIVMWARHMRASQKIPKGSDLDKTVNRIMAESSHYSDLDLARGVFPKMDEVRTLLIQAL